MNVETFMTAMPGLPRQTAEAYLPHMEAAMRQFQITTVPRARMWLAQVGHESLSLRYMEEIASGAAYEGRRDLGNTQPGDGRRFKGRGPVQLTGRHNYSAASRALGVDLVARPELAATPQYAFRVSAWWWWNAGLNAISDSGDVRAATRRINGGYNGLTDRQQRFTRIRNLGDRILPGPDKPPPAPKPVRVPDDRVAVSATDDGRLVIFLEADDGGIWRRWQVKDGRFSDWQWLGTPGAA